MNLQQVVDDAVDALRRQGGPAYDESTDSCFYELHNGRRCAVGILLSPTLSASASQVRAGVYTLFEMKPVIATYLYQKYNVEPDEQTNFRAFLGLLQSAHDHAASATRGNPAEFMEAFIHRLPDPRKFA